MKSADLWTPSRVLLCTPYGVRCITNSYSSMWLSNSLNHVFRIISFRVRRTRQNTILSMYRSLSLFLCLHLSDQPNILLVERSYANATTFELKTNKYVGPRAEEPAQLQLLDRYNALRDQFQFKTPLFPDKLKNLQGRELIIVGFDYRPYTVIKHVIYSKL